MTKTKRKPKAIYNLGHERGLHLLVSEHGINVDQIFHLDDLFSAESTENKMIIPSDVMNDNGDYYQFTTACGINNNSVNPTDYFNPSGGYTEMDIRLEIHSSHLEVINASLQG